MLPYSSSSSGPSPVIHHPSAVANPFSIRDVNIGKRVVLARALSKLGYCSRSQAATLIRSGSVTLNGRLVRDPEIPAQFPQDRIEVHGSPLAKASPIYLVMNKPRGVVTTRERPPKHDCPNGQAHSRQGVGEEPVV